MPSCRFVMDDFERTEHAGQKLPRRRLRVHIANISVEKARRASSAFLVPGHPSILRDAIAGIHYAAGTFFDQSSHKAANMRRPFRGAEGDSDGAAA